MWILPKNLETSSAFAADMVESSEDLSLPGLNLEHSLMWRSKPSPLQTWSRRWNRVPWFRHLCGRILKPSHHISFETELTSSLLDIHANPFQTPESAPVRMTPDISGPTSKNISRQCDLFDASLKTSKDTSVLDSEKSSKTWKNLVTKRRGEYLARVKSVRRISEKESTSWPTPAYQMGLTQKPTHSVPTPTASDHIIRQSTNQGASNGELNYSTNKSVSLDRFVAMWPTPTTQDNNQVKGKDKRGTTLGGAVRNWPTPTATDNGPGLDRNNPRGIQQGNALATAVAWKARGWWPTPTVQGSDKATKKMRDNHQNNLTALVFHHETFPTPTARDWKGGYTEASLTRKDGKSRRFDALPNAAIGGVGTDVKSGHLNPDWVEWLMDVPTGWTDLGSWGMAS